jgi:hypothetical protein
MKEELESNPVVPQFLDLQEADFDGHTEFASMSAEQRQLSSALIGSRMWPDSSS